jgi:hypothetical protein
MFFEEKKAFNLLFHCREFSNERTRVERRETFRKLRMRENFSRAFEGYFQWISKAGINNILLFLAIEFHILYKRHYLHRYKQCKRSFQILKFE